MDSQAKVLIPILLLSLFLVSQCARNFGIEFSSGVQGDVQVVDLPTPKSPSRVMGIGEAMAKGQDVLLFRQTRKSSSLPHNERNFFFITKLLESYSPQVKVIELPNSVTYPQGDFYSDIMDRFPGNGLGVIRKEGEGYKLYKSTFGYSEEYETMVLPVKDRIEQILGPAPFQKEALISKQSRYQGFTKAQQDGKNLILYSFAEACSRFPPAEQKRLEQSIKTQFAKEAEIVLIDHKAYTDPANELFAQGRSMVCVYNRRTKKSYPVPVTGSDPVANIRTFLNER
jgi:hypothetical protein